MMIVAVRGMAVMTVGSRRCGMSCVLMRCCWFRVVMAVRVIHFALLSGVKNETGFSAKMFKILTK